VRALEPVLAEARGRGGRSIVTGGRRDSNWAALAAVTAARDDYLGLGSRLDSGPSELLVQTGFSTETAQARYLHYWLGVLTVSRLAEDFLLFASAPFGYVRLHDSHCRASVYLPQKRNPYALTVVRGGYAVIVGRCDGVAAAMGTGSAQTDNWIYSYGETLATLGLARQLVQLMAEVLGKARFDTARMAALALDGFTEAADLAERLVTEEHIDYRTAHSRVARLAAEAERRGGTRLAGGTDPRALVLARAGEGSAAPAAVRASARRLRILLARHRAWRRDAQARADAAIGQLLGQARAASAVQPGPHITPIPEVPL
jgi:argininosuccinate lyase